MLRPEPDFDHPIFMGTAEFVGYEPSGREIVGPNEKTDLDLLLEDFANQENRATSRIDLIASAAKLYGERSFRKRDQIIRGTIRGLKTSFVIPLKRTADRL